MLTKEILNQINTSFKMVTLDGGIGYFQAIAIDNLVIEEAHGKEKYQIALKKDIAIGNDWQKLMAYIKETEIDFFPFSFMDTKGILFMLPSLLSLELMSELNSLLHDLVVRSDFWDTVLNDQQRKTIVKVYEYWHQEHINELQSYGMSTKAITEQTMNSDIYKLMSIF